MPKAPTYAIDCQRMTRDEAGGHRMTEDCVSKEVTKLFTASQMLLCSAEVGKLCSQRTKCSNMA
jgi:hypothetical protein